MTLLNTLHAMDLRVLHAINPAHHTIGIYISQVLSDCTSLVAFSIPLMLLLVGIVRKDRSLRIMAVVILASVVSADLVALCVKYAVARPRPFLVHPEVIKYGEGGSWSFPSGHTVEAFAFAVAVAVMAKRWYILFAAFTWACAVAFSRIHLGVHYPSDVLAAIFIGSTISFGVASICRRTPPSLLRP
jgi:undecaprenyl-diphosphatase